MNAVTFILVSNKLIIISINKCIFRKGLWSMTSTFTFMSAKR